MEFCGWILYRKSFQFSFLHFIFFYFKNIKITIKVSVLLKNYKNIINDIKKKKKIRKN